MNPSPISAKKCKAIRSGQTGFTLVELLVVIVMIVVLATIVFGISNKVSKKAQQVNAVSAMRQIVAASAGYSAENSGNINTLRFKGDPKEGGGGKWVSNSFWGRAQPYLFSGVSATNDNALKTELKERIGSLFATPDASKMTKTVMSGTRIYHDDSGLPVPFAFNSAMFPWNRFTKVSSFDTAEVIYATYGFGGFNENHGKTYEEPAKPGETPKSNIYYFEDRKAIAAFLDGHIEQLTPPMPERRFK